MKTFPNYLWMFLLMAACRPNDKIIIPSSLDFKELATVTGQGIFSATGFVGIGENALYMGHRQNDRERVVRIDLKTLKSSESNFEKLDFVTKELHVIDGELWVIGGQFINRYPLDLSDDPESIPHGLTLSRFGSAIFQNELYIWGGDLGGRFSDHIYKWLDDELMFQPLAALPSPKSWAHGEIVDDRIYIFGGQEQFRDTPPNDIIYVYDIQDTTVATLNLPEPYFRSFTGRHGPLIYVCGQVEGDNGGGDLDIRFGVFNTFDFTYTTIRTSLDDSLFETVHAVTIMSDRIFVVFGDPTAQEQSYKIMVANLP